MAGKRDGEVRYPSSKLVKSLNILSAGLGIASIVLDAVVPVAQQVTKRKQAKEGLERAISLMIFFTAIRTVPRLIREIRRLRTQIATPVAE